MALGQGRPEGGVAAGTEAVGIAEVLKSERAGRLLPFKEEQIISSAESLEEEGMTARPAPPLSCAPPRALLPAVGGASARCCSRQELRK